MITDRYKPIVELATGQYRRYRWHIKDTELSETAFNDDTRYVTYGAAYRVAANKARRMNRQD